MTQQAHSLSFSYLWLSHTPLLVQACRNGSDMHTELKVLCSTAELRMQVILGAQSFQFHSLPPREYFKSFFLRFNYHCVHVRTLIFSGNLYSLESVLRVKCMVYQLFHVTLQLGSSTTPHSVQVCC